MSNPRIRGLVYMAVALVVAWFSCVFLPFTVMPAAGNAVALPIIEVPGETVWYHWIGNFNLTNTFIGGLLASVIVLIWVGLTWRTTKGWTNEVPGRAQAWAEIFVEAFYDFCDSLGGENFRRAPYLWPLVASIFIFILAGNYLKLFPGAESFGYVHCAYAGQSGHPRVEMGVPDTWRLWVDQSLFTGLPQTEASDEDCVHALKVMGTYYGSYDPADYSEEAAAFEARLAAVQDVVTGSLPDRTLVLTQDDGEAEEGEEAEAAEDEAAEEPEDAEAAEEASAEEGEEAGATEDGEAAEEATEEEAVEDLASPEEVAVAFAELVEAEATFEEAEFETAEERNEAQAELEALQLEVTEMVYPHAAFGLTAAQLDDGRIEPYIFAITPWVRGVATDLSFNFGLAILSIVLVQVYGVWALGPSYFEKFINLGAIGNAGKRPLGLIDFVVGLIEIISELGKIISLAFRLFGNLFAGGIVLMVLSFLVAFNVPIVMYVLELIIGFVQALVFAVLTLVFVVQGMESHHHGDEEHGEHH